MKPLVAVALVLSLFASIPLQAGEKCHKQVQDCLNSMVTELKSTGFIGVELDKGKSDDSLQVTKVIANSPAEKAGIQVGDVLHAINGIPFNKKNSAAISKVKKPGMEVKVTILRNGANREMSVTLVPMPADLMAKYIGEHMMQHAVAAGDLAAKK